MTSKIREIYTDPENPGSFGGIAKLAKALRKSGYVRSKQEIKRKLSDLDAYTLHKPRRKKFKRNKFLISGIDDLWSSDLAVMQNIARYNDGVKYLLVTIDSLSKFAWVLPLKKKTADAVTNAIIDLLQTIQPRQPKNWLTDKGTEFRNARLKNYMKDKGINFYHTRNPETKAAIAERFIRTLKGRIARYLTYSNGWRYIDKLDKIVKGYNTSTHRTTGMRPSKITAQDVPAIKRKMYPDRIEWRPHFTFTPGDTVRLAKERAVFDKGYHRNWTEEIFVVSEAVPRDPPVYRVKDLSGEIVEGTFYEAEMQRVTNTSDTYKVEKILKTRKRNGKKEYLIKWLGYPESMSSWEPEENIQVL
jgi:transposase InsO family protein